MAAPDGQDVEYDYTPAGTTPGPMAGERRRDRGFGLAVAAIGLWVFWNTRRFFYADVEAPVTSQIATTDFDAAWAACSPDERHVLLQVTREHVANPYQRPVVSELLRRGLLRLDPDLRPFSEDFEQFLLQQESKHAASYRRGSVWT